MIIQRETHIKSPKKISRHEVKQKPKKLIVKQKKIKVEPTNPRAIVTLTRLQILQRKKKMKMISRINIVGGAGVP